MQLILNIRLRDVIRFNHKVSRLTSIDAFHYLEERRKRFKSRVY